MVSHVISNFPKRLHCRNFLWAIFGAEMAVKNKSNQICNSQQCCSYDICPFEEDILTVSDGTKHCGKLYIRAKFFLKFLRPKTCRGNVQDILRVRNFIGISKLTDKDF